MHKKIIKIIIICVIIAGIVVGAIFGVSKYQNSKLEASVVPVSGLNYGNYEYMESEGLVTNDAAQSIFLDSSLSVAEVFVQEGQEIHVGDKILAYDTTSMEMTIEKKKIEITRLEGEYVQKEKELAVLRNTTPVVEQPPVEPEEPVMPEKLSGKAYNYLEASDVERIGEVSYKGEGTKEKPYKILCSQTCYALGEFFNALNEEGFYVSLDTTTTNNKKGVVDSWVLYGASLPEYEMDTKIAVATRKIVYDEDPYEDDFEEEEPDTGTQYTEVELRKAIAEAEKDLRKLDIDKRKAALELSDLERESSDGIVYAKINGIVKSVGEDSSGNSPYISITGSEGLYVKGVVSELLLDQIKIGQSVTANCWMNGQNYTATISGVDNYPEENPNYWGSGNPNVSYYSYTAFIENPEGLSSGDYLSLTIDDLKSDPDAIFLDSSYVRTVDGKTYVMKEENGVLVKQYVKTGKTGDGGYTIEIVSGITADDFIAFPYGKTAQEGIATVHSDEW